MEFIVAEEGIPQNIGCQGALIAYCGSEIEFHYETVPPHGDEIFSAKLPLLELELPFWIYGRNLIFLDAYYLLAETVKKGTWNPITTILINIHMGKYASLDHWYNHISIEQIGKDFEFHRESIHPDYIEAADKGLAKLYELFDVKPVEKRLTHDGVSPIKLVEGSWEEQYEQLWSFLIPSSGPAKTVQGEVIRIPGRVRDELDRNGGANWDRDYRKMLQAMPHYLSLGTPLSDQELEEIKQAIAQIHSKENDDEASLDRLCQLALAWIKQNPKPIDLEEPSYNR